MLGVDGMKMRDPPQDKGCKLGMCCCASFTENCPFGCMGGLMKRLFLYHMLHFVDVAVGGGSSVIYVG